MLTGSLALALLLAADAVAPRPAPVEVSSFRVLERDSGPVNYYRLLSERGEPFVRGDYAAGLQTVTLFAPAPEAMHRGVQSFRWRWRARTLPLHGNECRDGLGDSAASVYLTWKRGLRWYSLKFVWSTDAPRGATCNRIRNPFVASDSVVLRSGGPVGVWMEEQVNPEQLFREHFAEGDADAEIPELQGIGILTDGDQTNSPSAADYAGFVLSQDRFTRAQTARLPVEPSRP